MKGGTSSTSSSWVEGRWAVPLPHSSWTIPGSAGTWRSLSATPRTGTRRRPCRRARSASSSRQRRTSTCRALASSSCATSRARPTRPTLGSRSAATSFSRRPRARPRCVRCMPSRVAEGAEVVLLDRAELAERFPWIVSTMSRPVRSDLPARDGSTASACCRRCGNKRSPAASSSCGMRSWDWIAGRDGSMRSGWHPAGGSPPERSSTPRARGPARSQRWPGSSCRSRHAGGTCSYSTSARRFRGVHSSSTRPACGSDPKGGVHLRDVAAGRG